MKTKIFALFAAMMLLVGTTAMAQSDNTESATEIKGDVNSDGIVDVADIAAVIAVMHEQGTVAPQYYWYAGWTEPTEANIGEIINEEYPVSSTNTTMNKAGGSTTVITGYDKVTPLYYYGDNRYNPGRKQYYLVLPNGIGVYGSDGANSLLDKYSLQESINIPNHKVYISNSGSSNIAGLMLY